jgi:hypothetical protein
MTHTDVCRLTPLTLRYFRRFAAIAPEVDTRRLARSLEARLPEPSHGPLARALLQHLVSETAARHAVMPKW